MKTKTKTKNTFGRKHANHAIIIEIWHFVFIFVFGWAFTTMETTQSIMHQKVFEQFTISNNIDSGVHVFRFPCNKTPDRQGIEYNLSFWLGHLQYTIHTLHSTWDTLQFYATIPIYKI